LDFQRDLLGEAAQRPDSERQGDELIGEDKPGVCVTQPDPLVQQVERDHESDEWHEPEAHEDKGERVLRWEGQSWPAAGMRAATDSG